MVLGVCKLMGHRLEQDAHDVQLVPAWRAPRRDAVFVEVCDQGE